MPDVTIPSVLARNVVDVWRGEGRAWLARLPNLLDEYAERWGVQVGPPFEDLSFNYVAPVECSDGTPAVLKLGVPCEERTAEVEALQLFDGRGAGRLLEGDARGGALLMERLRPGRPLSETARTEDATAVAEAAELMRELWQPTPVTVSLPTVMRWAAGFARLRGMFGGTTGPLPESLVHKAESIFVELCDSEPPHLLHGDLHLGNILSAERRPWLAIDPKGLIGARGYDAGNFLRSDLPPGIDPSRAFVRRIDQLADELGFAKSVLRDWAFAQAVLSAWWSVEDHGSGSESTIADAETLAALRF